MIVRKNGVYVDYDPHTGTYELPLEVLDAPNIIEYQLVAFETLYKISDKKEEPELKVSYNGVTGELLKLERNQPKGKLLVDGVDYSSAIEHLTYTLEIYDDHNHTFDNVDLKEVQFIGATVTLA